MNQQKGFSLVEVLVSLMLVSTVALAFLQQQWQTRQLLNQLILQTEASQYVDQTEETLFVTWSSSVNEDRPIIQKSRKSGRLI